MSANPHGNMSKRDRRVHLLGEAVRIARLPGGWSGLSRSRVAEAGRVSNALVSLSFGSMGNLRRAVMKTAIQNGHLDLIAQGIAAGYPMCLRLPSDVKQKALKSLGN